MFKLKRNKIGAYFIVGMSFLLVISFIILFINLLFDLGFISYSRGTVTSNFKKNENLFNELVNKGNDFVASNELRRLSVNESIEKGLNNRIIVFYSDKWDASDNQSKDFQLEQLAKELFQNLTYQSVDFNADGQVLFRLASMQGVAYLPYGGYINSNILVYSRSIGGKWYYFEEKYVRVNDMKG